MYTILQAFTQGKNPAKISNEDGLVQASNCVGVVDGASAKDSTLYEGKLSGEFAKDVVVAALSQTTGLESAYQVVARVTDALHSEVLRVSGHTPSTRTPALRPSAAFVVFLPHTRELVFVGDCHALIDTRYISFPQPFEHVVSQIRANYFSSLRMQGHSDEDLVENYQSKAWEVIVPAIHWGAELRNQSGNSVSFSVMDGTEIPRDLIYVLPVAADTRFIAMATDGYTELLNSFESTEIKLHTLIKEDPLCIAALKGCKGVLPGNISFDDRSYLAVEINLTP